jgi:hypothetical protein
MDVKLSASADLGYTYGAAEFKPQDKSRKSSIRITCAFGRSSVTAPGESFSIC